MNQISTKLAASDLIKKIQQKLFLYKLFVILIIIIYFCNMIGIILQGTIICLIILAWQYHKDLKEIDRLENTYGL